MSIVGQGVVWHGMMRSNKSLHVVLGKHFLRGTAGRHLEEGRQLCGNGTLHQEAPFKGGGKQDSGWVAHRHFTSRA